MDFTPLLTVLLGISTAALGFLAYTVLSLRSMVAEREGIVEGARNDETERVVELSLDLLCATNFDGYVKLVNPAFTRALGWTRQELSKVPFLEFVHPDDRGAVQAEMERMRRGLPTIDFRSRALCRDGSYRLLSWRCMPDVGRGIIYSVARDVTEDEQLFRTFVENIDQVVWMEDPDTRRVLYISPSYERVWGRPRSRLYENSAEWLDGIHPEDRPRAAAAWASQYVAGTFSEEYRVVRPDGSVRWVRDRGIPIRAPGGKITRMLGLAEDITEYKAAQRELGRAERLASIGTLAAGLAHEIRNPVGGIRLAAETALRSGDSGPRGERALQDIVEESERCERIVEMILTFARQSTSEKRVCDVSDALRRAHEAIRRDADRYGARIGLELMEPSASASFNEADLQQVIRNLVENACQAGAHNVKLCTERAGDSVRVVVQDDGRGIAQADQERLFEPFFTTRREQGGTGLGLSLVHGIVADHGGSIAVESETGHGTRMILTFPAIRTQEAARGGNGASAHH